MLAFCIGCRDDSSGKPYYVNVDSTQLVQVWARESNLDAQIVTILGHPKILYDTCKNYLSIGGFIYVEDANRVSIKGTITIGDTIWFPKQSEIVFYDEKGYVIRVIKGGEPNNQ